MISADPGHALRSIAPSGGTYPRPAFERVFGLAARADGVYFLTGGDLFGFTPTDCARLRTSGTSSAVGAAL